MPASIRALFAEFFGTFFLIFAGTGAIIVNQETAALGHAGIALTFGLVVLALIYTFGEVSGAHFNPAVTMGFVAARRFPIRSAACYIPIQLLAAVAASLLLKLLFPENQGLGGTQPNGAVSRSFVFELILTWFLMLAVLSVSTGAKEKGITAGIAIGSIIGLEAMFAGPICGASMNPARSFGPALISGNLEHLWIYFTAPIIGALIAVPSCVCVQEPGCCSSKESCA